MGKHLDDESVSKQAGCMWGIVHVLDYHHWHSNVRKMIHHHKHEGRSHNSNNHQCNWSPDATVRGPDDGQEKLLDEQQNAAKTKRTRSSKRRSLRARFKAMLSEETSMEDKDSAKSSLQRTYSIHHLESVDDFFGKIRKNWNHPIIFFPRNSEDCPSQSSDVAQAKEDRPDVFEIFKVDKELLLKHLQDSDEGVANFSRSAFGLNTKGKFSKSRSFPVADMAERRKLKPLKLESKHKEIWSFPKIVDKSEPSESLDYREVNNAADRLDNGGITKHTHRRSFSLNESVDRYARLYGNSSVKDVKFSSSKSLKLASEYGYAPLNFKRMPSLSNADSYYSDVNSEVLDDNPSGANLVVITEDSSSRLRNSKEEEVISLARSLKETPPLSANVEIKEDDASLRLHTSNEKLKNEESCEDEADQLKESALADCLDEGFVSGSDIFLQEDEIKEETIHHHKKNSDIDYVMYLLENSGIAVDASEMTWHTSDQLFGPQLFEEVEAGWPHAEGELDGWPEFQGCWHHQMLFDAVNEALLDVYDISLPYYPKALSSNCHVRPFPVGDRLIEEVCTSIGSLMNVKPEEKQSLDDIVGRDLARDHSWMNLQIESEAVALDIEDMIFNELLQEVMFS